MASDSIIAKPINNVLVIDFSASGCLANASRAWLIARPMASAGPIVPIAIARAAITVEAKLNQLKLFIIRLLVLQFL